MLIEAARRGARVRLLLDSFFDEPEANRSNQATVEYLAAIATAEGLDIMGAVGDPTGGGIHMKLVLVSVGGETWSAVGSLNGGEISHKVNREVLLLVDLPAVYDRLVEVFRWDWSTPPISKVAYCAANVRLYSMAPLVNRKETQ